MNMDKQNTANNWKEITIKENRPSFHAIGQKYTRTEIY
jgi:hypothetical protein